MRILPAIVACLPASCLLAASEQPAEIWFEHGRSAFEEHDDSGEAMRDAEADFRRALLLNPRHSASVAYLGLIAAERGDQAAAETLYRRALDLDAKCAEALVGLARRRIQDRRHDEARSLLREAVRARPENRLALRELAVVLSAESFRPTQETWREAIACWRTLIRLDRNDRDAHHDLARAHRLFESWASAEDEYREVLRIGQQPDDGDVWVYSVHGDLAEMLEKQGKLLDAVAEWRALAASPTAGDEEIRRARERIAELEKRPGTF